MWAIAAFAWASHIHHVLKTGAFDFSKMDTEGPYKVGVRRIKITEKKLEAAVFYPVDKSTDGPRALWFEDAEKTIAGMQ